MNRIDQWIDLLFRSNADRLRICGGRQVEICAGAKSRPLTKGVVSEKLVNAWIAESLPEVDSPDADSNEAYQVEYRSPSGLVLATVVKRPDVTELTIRKTTIESGSKAKERMDDLLSKMVQERCSDLHLCSQNAPMFRKDGSIVHLDGGERLSPEAVRELVYAITPTARREEFESSHDTDFGYEISGVARFRCNLFRDVKGVGAVFRVIPNEIISAEDLGLPEAVLDLCSLPKGLVVVTGPTGSGKSTTLAGMIDHINRNRSEHIITIEDPVEFVHPNKCCLINQREVGDHTSGFKRALRAALREDPDIVLVGEMRDLETVEIAIETAETGHLVFGTLHTNTAASTVDRIIDQFPADRQNQVRSMLSESLRGVVAQTLCVKQGGGRVAALEVLLVNRAVSNLIREGKTFQIPSVIQTGGRQGMISMNQSLLELAVSGTIAPDEACRRSLDPAEMFELLKSKGLVSEEADPDAGILILKHLT